MLNLVLLISGILTLQNLERTILPVIISFPIRPNTGISLTRPLTSRIFHFRIISTSLQVSCCGTFKLTGRKNRLVGCIQPQSQGAEKFESISA
jgi:hypothetical protein